jgi:hypothetical protein
MPAPKAAMPLFPGLAGGKGGMDFSAFAKPRESTLSTMPEFANKVPKAKPPPGADSQWESGAAEPAVKHIDTTVATYVATHKQWSGQVELGANGQFTRIGKDGGHWTIVWDAQRETDDGDKSGELQLQWSKWGLETLRTTDGGRTFRHLEYVFELELMAPTVPKWLIEDLTAAPPTKHTPTTDPRGAGQATSKGAGAATWERGASVPAKAGEEGAEATAAQPEEVVPEPQARAPARRPGRKKMQFAMPSRQERAAALARRYRDIGETLFSGFPGAEPTEIVGFLKKTIGDIHQLTTLEMKYSKDVAGEKTTAVALSCEILGMTKESLVDLRKCRLIRYLENDEEKRIKVLQPLVEMAFKVIKPFLGGHGAASAAEVRESTYKCPVRGVDLQLEQKAKYITGKQFGKASKKMAAEKAAGQLSAEKIAEVEKHYGADFWDKWA